MRFFSTEFGRDFKVLLLGNSIARFIPFIALPFLQKWFFGPDDFGVLAMFVALTGPFISIASLRYEYAIVLAKRVKEQSNLLYLSLTLVMAVTLIHWLVVLLFEQQLVDYQGDSRIRQFLYWTPLGTLFMGIFNVFTYWMNRTKSYAQISQVKVVQTCSSEGYKVWSGWQGISSGLIIGTLVGQGVSAAMVLFRFFKNEANLLRLFSGKFMVKMAKKYKKFPLFTMPNGFLTAAVSTLYFGKFSQLFGAESVGLIGTSVTYFAGLMGIVSLSFSQIFYRNIVDIDSMVELRKIYTKYLLILSLVTAGVVLIIYVIPADWVANILGDSWAELIPVMRYMAIWLGVAFVYASLSFIYIKLERQRFMLLLSGINLALVYFVLSWQSDTPDFYSALSWFTIAQAGYYVFAIVMVYVVMATQKPKEIEP